MRENPKVRDDIKGKRQSHLSSPVGDDTEFHLRTSELSCDPEPGGMYYVCFKTECTSKGDDSGVEMARFVQIEHPDVVDAEEYEEMNKVDTSKEEKLENKLGKVSKKLQERY